MNKWILIVDDDADIRTSIEDVLVALGYEVLAAANGQEALKLLATRDPPSVILLDLMMPVMNGWQFKAQLVAQSRFAKIPVIVVSADGNVFQKAEKIGVTGCLKKPVEFDDLLQVATRYCRVPVAS